MALVAFAASASAASAATLIGQLPPSNPLLGCVEGVNSVQKAAVGNSYEVPAGGGVITGWTHLGNTTTPGSGRLLVLKLSSGTTYTVVGRSVVQGFSGGASPSYPAQISVSGGELLGLHTHTADDGCDFTGAGGDDSRFGSTGDPNAGDLVNFPNDTSTVRINVRATLEPDCDKDGLGDETQDLFADQATCTPLSPPPAAKPKKCKRKKKGKAAAAGKKCKRKKK